jgi:large subunit ribosomal protein L6
MSRIGKLPVALPKGVSVLVGDGNLVTVSGPKGKLDMQFPADISIEIEANEARVSRPSDAKHHKALHGLSRSLLNNMVTGVNSGFARVIEVEGVGYRAGMIGPNLVIFAGYSHPIEMVPPPGVSFEVDKPGRQITVNGIDKQVVGQMVAQIRELRPPEPYKGKGFRNQGEVIRRKAGKSGKIGGKGKK